MKELTEHDVLGRLRMLKTYGTRHKDLAKRFGVTTSFISAVLAGDKKPNEKMLRAIKVRRVKSERYYDTYTP